MSKKWIIIAVVAVVAVAAIVGAIALGADDTPTTTVQGGSSTSKTTSSGETSTPGASTPTSSTTTKGTGKGTKNSTTTSSTTPPLSGTMGGTVVIIGEPFPAVPQSKAPAVTVTSPVAKGTVLAPLTEAPEPTISGLALDTVPAGSEYQIRMRPYGIGPSVFYGSRICIRVDSATPKNGAPDTKAIDNANLLVVMDTNHGGTVTKGGTYTAKLVFLSDGTKLLPVLSEAKAAN